MALTCSLVGLAGLACAADEPAKSPIDPAHFFLFHADGAKPEDFQADLFYCMALAREIRGDVPQVYTGGGLFGALISAGIQAKQASTDRKRKGRLAMRICMSQFGYTRYTADPASWPNAPDWGDLVKDDTMTASNAHIVKIIAFATGPKPQNAELVR